ncbi:hypothetical protein FJ977_18685 [Mesorhizobium sp. B2-1-3A]|nr:hypothetical protein FJ977_18685 [Mesorhizobium sp. B2-1-3A]
MASGAENTPANDVRVERLDGEWAVQIVENGNVTQRLFENEQFAKNFANGQRMRLAPSGAASTCGYGKVMMCLFRAFGRFAGIQWTRTLERSRLAHASDCALAADLSTRIFSSLTARWIARRLFSRRFRNALPRRMF